MRRFGNKPESSANNPGVGLLTTEEMDQDARAGTSNNDMKYINHPRQTSNQILDLDHSQTSRLFEESKAKLR